MRGATIDPPTESLSATCASIFSPDKTLWWQFYIKIFNVLMPLIEEGAEKEKVNIGK